MQEKAKDSCVCLCVHLRVCMYVDVSVSSQSHKKSNIHPESDKT